MLLGLDHLQKEIIEKDAILLEQSVPDKMTALSIMADCLKALGYLSDTQCFLADVQEREQQFSTCIGQGIAIPHGKSDAVLHTGVCMMRLNTPICWQDQKVDFITLLAIEKKHTDIIYLKMLADLSVHFLHEDFVKQLKSGTKEEIYRLVIKNTQR